MKNKHKRSSGYDPKNTEPQNTVGGREVSTRVGHKLPFVHSPFTGERVREHPGMYAVYIGAVKPTNAVLVNVNGVWFKVSASGWWYSTKQAKRIDSCLPKGVEAKLLHPQEMAGLVEHGYERLVHRTLTGEKLDPDDTTDQWWGSHTGRLSKTATHAQAYGMGAKSFLKLTAIMPTTKEK